MKSLYTWLIVSPEGVILNQSGIVYGTKKVVTEKGNSWYDFYKRNHPIKNKDSKLMIAKVEG